jgi:hypothetical protein
MVWSWFTDLMMWSGVTELKGLTLKWPAGHDDSFRVIWSLGGTRRISRRQMVYCHPRQLFVSRRIPIVKRGRPKLFSTLK